MKHEIEVQNNFDWIRRNQFQISCFFEINTNDHNNEQKCVEYFCRLSFDRCLIYLKFQLNGSQSVLDSVYVSMQIAPSTRSTKKKSNLFVGVRSDDESLLCL